MSEWSPSFISSLPDSAFACIDGGGDLDDSGRTVPRSLRHYPHHNAAGHVDRPHLVNALARVAQEDTTSCGVSHLRDHAQEEGIGKAVPDTIQRKAFTPADFKLTDSGQIEAAFAQFNVVDLDGDVTLPGAFPVKDVPLSAYGHSSWDGALPVGKGTISERGDWAIFNGAFFMNTSQGKDAYETLKGLGALAQYSYGYHPLEFSFGQHDGRDVRFLKSLDVFEVSPVLLGAGVGTHTLAIKSGAPEADAPPAEILAWYTGWLPAFLDRVKAHRLARQTEGRKLSRTDRAQLEDLETALTTHLETVRELLVVPESPKAAEQRRMDLELLLGEARALGVTL